MNLYSILIKPIVTEKSSKAWEKGKYTFVINPGASKIDVKQAIEKLYGVKATAVNVRPTVKKVRVVGRGKIYTKRDAVKKATVTLEKGKNIDVYKFKS